MCLNPYLKKMSSQINDCSYIWVNFYVITKIIRKYFVVLSHQ